MDEENVKINAKGTIIETQRSVLTKVKDSAMEAMFSGRHYVEQVDGAVFIDKDPEIFKLVLAYLKENKWPPKSLKKLVEIELEFWGLPTMEEKEKLKFLENILNSEPSASDKALAIWQPLNLQELISQGCI